MFTAISIAPHSCHQLDDVPDAVKDSEVRLSDFKAVLQQITQQSDPAAPMSAVVSNAMPYLTEWALANTANAAFNQLESYGKDTAQLVVSVFLLGAVVVDFLGTQNGYAAITQRRKYLESLKELVTAVQGGALTNLELAEKTARCAKDLQAAEALPGWTEFIAKIGTDAVAGINTLTQQINTYITIAFNRSAGDLLGDALTHDQGDSNTLQKAVELTSSKLAIATSSIVVGTSLANFIRGVAEAKRLHGIGKTLNANIQVIDNGIAHLEGKTGTAVLKHVKQSFIFRKFANFAAWVGAIFRIFNGCWGIASKIVFLVCGAVIAPWVAPFVAAIVLLTYAIKGFVQMYYTRKATRLDNLLANTIKALARGSEKHLRMLKAELVKDLQALARGGKHLRVFLEGMGRLNLYTKVQDQLRNVSRVGDRFPIIKRVIDICTTATDIVHQALKNSKDAAHAEIASHILESDTLDDDVPEPSFVNEQALEDELPHEHPDSVEAFTPEEVKTFNVFMRGKLEKMIASLEGQLPGWRLDSGNKEVVKKMSEEAIKATVGDSSETDLLLKVIGGLHTNGKKRNGKASTFFSILIKSRTWSLTRHAKDCEKALENQDPTQLKSTTLAAALTTDNAKIIAQCRFKGNVAEQEALAHELANSAPSALKALVKVLEKPCSDDKKIDMLQREAKKLGIKFESTLKAALMLSGLDSKSADGAVAAWGRKLNATPKVTDNGALGKQDMPSLEINLNDSSKRRLISVSNVGNDTISPSEGPSLAIIPPPSRVLQVHHEDENRSVVGFKSRGLEDLPAQKRRMSEDPSSLQNMLKEIHRRRRLDDEHNWMQLADAAHAHKAAIDKVWKAKALALSDDQPLSALSAV